MTAKPNEEMLVQTVLQMHGAIVELSGQIGKLNGQVGTFITQMATQDDRTNKVTERLGKIENRQHWYAGLGTAVGALGTWFAQHFAFNAHA